MVPLLMMAAGRPATGAIPDIDGRGPGPVRAAVLRGHRSSRPWALTAACSPVPACAIRAGSRDRRSAPVPPVPPVGDDGCQRSPSIGERVIYAGGVVAPTPTSVAVRAGEVVLGTRHWPGASTGVPVLLVHGLAANARVWDGVAAVLAASGRHVLAVDLRGHGTSAAVPDPPHSDPTRVAAVDLSWICASLGWPRVVVAGHSWGAHIALQLAADLPHLVAGLALVDGGWRPYPDRFADLDTAWRRMAPPDLTGFALHDVREVLAGAHPDWSSAAVEANLANLRQHPDGTLAPWLTTPRHYDRIASLFAHRPRELHRRVRCRAVLLAADDPPHQSAHEAASIMTEAELTGFPGGEHDLHLQFPDRVAAAIARLA